MKWFERLRQEYDLGRINNASDLYSVLNGKFEQAADAIAFYIFGYKAVGFVESYDLSCIMLDYEYSWAYNIESINENILML